MLKLIVHILILFVRSYQILVSPFTMPICRFSPSCSYYALQALRQHGLLGIVLILKRLGRCHPFGGYGYDPVPKALNKQSHHHE